MLHSSHSLPRCSCLLRALLPPHRPTVPLAQVDGFFVEGHPTVDFNGVYKPIVSSTPKTPLSVSMLVCAARSVAAAVCVPCAVLPRPAVHVPLLLVCVWIQECGAVRAVLHGLLGTHRAHKAVRTCVTAKNQETFQG